MKINNNQSPNFGYCKIQKSAYPIIERLPDRHITELFEQASRIDKTKYWDLWIAGRKNISNNEPQFFMKFINKENFKDNSFCGDITPLRLDKSIVSVKATGKNNPNSYLLIPLAFSSPKRAKEVFVQLSHPQPQSNMERLARAVDFIKILEESSGLKDEPKEQNKLHPFFKKILSFLGLKK